MYILKRSSSRGRSSSNAEDEPLVDNSKRSRSFSFSKKKDSSKYIKEGVLYSDIRCTLQSFDLVFFRGDDFISDFIAFLEKRELIRSKSSVNISNDVYTHIGIIIKSDVLDDDRLDKDKVYIWESTMSGRLTDGVNNIDGKAYLGVQLRDFDEVMQHYDRPNDTKIAVGYLSKEIRERWYYTSRPELLKSQFTKIFTGLNGIFYDANPVALFGSLSLPVCCCMRKCRDATDVANDEWLFCSELVANVFQTLMLIPPDVNPKNVIPMDFLGFDGDTSGRVPLIIEEPKCITTEQHYVNVVSEYLDKNRVSRKISFVNIGEDNDLYNTFD